MFRSETALRGKAEIDAIIEQAGAAEGRLAGAKQVGSDVRVQEIRGGTTLPCAELGPCTESPGGSVTSVCVSGSGVSLCTSIRLHAVVITGVQSVSIGSSLGIWGSLMLLSAGVLGSS